MHIEIPLKHDKDPDCDWTRTEICYLLIRSDHPSRWKGYKRFIKWHYDGRPNWTLRLLGLEITIGRDYRDSGKDK